MSELRVVLDTRRCDLWRDVSALRGPVFPAISHPDSELRLHDSWVVPGSFKDTRNPFGPDDAIVRSAPIPGELQVTADAGSVFMQGAQFLLVESPRWLLSLSTRRVPRRAC